MRQKDLRRLRKRAKVKQQRRPAHHSALAYSGGKYHKEWLVPLFVAVESGVLMADAMSEQTLTDADVARALEQMVRDIRHGKLSFSEVSESHADDNLPTETQPLVAACVQRRVRDELLDSDHPGNDNLIGVLRSTLGSIEVRGRGKDSRHYLMYIRRFLGKAGIVYERITDEQAQALMELE